MRTVALPTWVRVLGNHTDAGGARRTLYNNRGDADCVAVSCRPVSEYCIAGVVYDSADDDSKVLAGCGRSACASGIHGEPVHLARSCSLSWQLVSI